MTKSNIDTTELQLLLHNTLHLNLKKFKKLSKKLSSDDNLIAQGVIFATLNILDGKK